MESDHHEVTQKGVRPVAGILENFRKKFFFFIFSKLWVSTQLDGYYEQKYIIFHPKNAKCSLEGDTAPIFCRFRKKRNIMGCSFFRVDFLARKYVYTASTTYCHLRVLWMFLKLKFYWYFSGSKLITPKGVAPAAWRLIIKYLNNFFFKEK